MVTKAEGVNWTEELCDHPQHSGIRKFVCRGTCGRTLCGMTAHDANGYCNLCWNDDRRDANDSQDYDGALKKALAEQRARYARHVVTQSNRWAFKVYIKRLDAEFPLQSIYCYGHASRAGELHLWGFVTGVPDNEIAQFDTARGDEIRQYPLEAKP